MNALSGSTGQCQGKGKGHHHHHHGGNAMNGMNSMNGMNAMNGSSAMSGLGGLNGLMQSVGQSAIGMPTLGAAPSMPTSPFSQSTCPSAAGLANQVFGPTLQ